MYNGPDKQKEQLRNSLRQRQLAAHDQWRKLAAGLGPSAAETFREYERAAQELGVVSRSAALRLQQLRDDDLLKLDPKREQAAREELRLLTSGPEDAADVLLRLAAGDDELAGCRRTVKRVAM